jgi:hypothetical protein
MTAGARAALVLILAALPAGGARGEDEAVLRLACTLREGAAAVPSAPAWGRSFAATVPFGEGHSLALLDPETGRPTTTVHSADVLAGRLGLPGEEAVLLWTRAMSRRAPLVGQAIRPNGHGVTLLLARPAGDGGRSLTLFDSETATAWQGTCSSAWQAGDGGPP